MGPRKPGRSILESQPVTLFKQNFWRKELFVLTENFIDLWIRRPRLPLILPLPTGLRPVIFSRYPLEESFWGQSLTDPITSLALVVSCASRVFRLSSRLGSTTSSTCMTYKAGQAQPLCQHAQHLCGICHGGIAKE